ncbi:MAG: cation transporter [Pseudomonadota bacterium]
MAQKDATRTVHDDVAVEHRAMDLTRWANLGMGIVGALAAWASSSQAVLIDGLLSLIGYIAAVYAMRISKTAHLGPNRQRPFGHAADEALYAMFRSLALLGLVLFGISQAVLGIADYVVAGQVERVWLPPIALYTVVIASTCFALAVIHWRAWTRTGRKSDMLKLEATASVYDGFITLLAGAGLLSAPLMVGTPLAPLAPVMDSVTVLVLCSVATVSYWRVFRKGVAQLAGYSASTRDQLALRRSIKRALGDRGGHIIDVAVVRMGRKLDAVVYYDPGAAVTAEDVDDLTRQMDRQLALDIGPVSVVIVVSKAGRELE